MPSETQPFFIKLSHVLISLTLITIILYVGQSIFIPLAFACLWTLILIAPCRFLEKHKVPETVAAAISLSLSIFIVLSVLYFISFQVANFKNELPLFIQHLQIVLADLELYLKTRFNLHSINFNNIWQSISKETLSHTPSIVGTTFYTLSNILVYMILVPIYTFLLLIYRKAIVQFLIKCFKDEHSHRVMDVLHKSKSVIKSYVVGLAIEMFIVASMSFAGFLVFGVKYALLLATIVAILNLIPYLGILTAGAISLLVTFTTGSTITVLGVVVVLTIVHLIDSNILLPKIVGAKVKINALASLLGVVVGSMLWGIPGMFLAIPIIAILKVIFDAVDDLHAWGYILSDTSHDDKKEKKNFYWKKFLNRMKK